MSDAHIRWFLQACFGFALAVATGGCGGKLLGDLPVGGGDAFAPSPVVDAAPHPLDGAGSPQVGSDADAVTGPSDAGVENLDDSLLDHGEADAPHPPPMGAAFSASCSTYAGVVGRVSCEGCVSRAQAQPTCAATWAQLSMQCQSNYLCVVSNCFCTSPCSTAGLCSCAAGCLPANDGDPCVRLWSEAMKCVGSACTGGC